MGKNCSGHYIKRHYCFANLQAVIAKVILFIIIPFILIDNLDSQNGDDRTATAGNNMSRYWGGGGGGV